MKDGWKVSVFFKVDEYYFDTLRNLLAKLLDVKGVGTSIKN